MKVVQFVRAGTQVAGWMIGNADVDEAGAAGVTGDEGAEAIGAVGAAGAAIAAGAGA